MNYEFPEIRNISDVLPAIDGRSEFVVADKGSYTIVNYNVMFEDTFPPVTTLNDAIRRECRGIAFDSVTGDIIRRPFHKFFNVSEREETQADKVDLSLPHIVLEKLDGSMICPFIVDGDIIWGTKMAAPEFHETVSRFVSDKPEYEEFVRLVIQNGFSPIFEWCSRKNRIVIDYPEDQLILTGMRDMVNGGYFVHSAMEVLSYSNKSAPIPIVRAFSPINDMKQFIDYVSCIDDSEGFVIRFDNGQMLKAKSHWYLQIHKAKEAILQDRNIVSLILDEHLDDVKAHLPTEGRDRLTAFEDEFNTEVGAVVVKIADILYDIVGKMDRKTFALEVASDLDPYIRPIVFKNFEGYSLERLLDDVHNTIRNNLSKTVKYEAIRDIWFPNLRFN